MKMLISEKTIIVKFENTWVYKYLLCKLNGANKNKNKTKVKIDIIEQIELKYQ